MSTEGGLSSYDECGLEIDMDTDDMDDEGGDNMSGIKPALLEDGFAKPGQTKGGFEVGQ